MTTDSTETARIHAADETTSAADLQRYARHKAWFVRCAVARNKNTPAGVLHQLAMDSHWAVRNVVAANPSCTVGTLELLAGGKPDTWACKVARERLTIMTHAV